MPATNYTPIQLYRTNTASTTAPSGANLNAGELAINYNDSGMILYAKNTSGTVIKLMNNPANLLYPTTDGTANQVIKTNGSGVLSFATVVTSPGGSTTQVQYNNAGVFGGITNATTDGTTLSMTSPKIITAINDTNANELIKFTATGSAVNEITVANAATTANPVISATGGDTNIGITLTPKGTGGVTTANCLAVGGATPSTSGAGVTFPATQSASSNANTLDDYEEGTFTPSLFGWTGTYANQTGYYVKIGRLLKIYGQVVTNSGTGTFSQQFPDLLGLPYNITNIGNAIYARWSGGGAGFSVGAGFTVSGPMDYGGTTQLFFNIDGINNNGNSNLQNTMLNASINIAIRFEGTMLTTA
ncbi:MAG: hypothetical protein EBR82_76025 [Caulobacteraceae bacterium]|nr:hypothetical protein [Caulobacteraceae bacterium]